jgi:hypothetical protein
MGHWFETTHSPHGSCWSATLFVNGERAATGYGETEGLAMTSALLVWGNGLETRRPAETPA